jgi:hypothetical protein
MRFTCGKLMAVLGLILLSAQGAPGQGKFGFGLVAGDPTGLAWRVQLDHGHSMAGSVGFLPEDNVRVGADFLWQVPVRGASEFSAYYGPGVFVGSGERRVYYFSNGRYEVVGDRSMVGVRLALGVTYTIPRSPVDLFLEFAPGIILTAPAGGMVDVGLGARVYP